MDRGVAAETEVNGVSEGKKARLSEQHVERQREHRRNAHLTQQ